MALNFMTDTLSALRGTVSFPTPDLAGALVTALGKNIQKLIGRISDNLREERTKHVAAERTLELKLESDRRFDQIFFNKAWKTKS